MIVWANIKYGGSFSGEHHNFSARKNILQDIVIIYGLE